MEIKKAEFVISNTDYKKSPEPTKPEYAFIGRSNVGKSSLINMLTNQKGLAKTSGTPGKTQLINHFLINDQWYLVDLPGYGYAKVSKKTRQQFNSINTQYILNRSNLINLFVLVDSRHDPQKIDLEFMEWLGKNGIPFSIIFTKIDKLGSSSLQKNIAKYKKTLLQQWEEIPQYFISSATSKTGKTEILHYIETINEQVSEHFN
ncbi:putative GTP-binding protein EngB [Flavobacteriaceae bacterium UJ101]|nr:putative GTP-binding protein EngB [Flavobacteriaceae bacterium UJ101]